MPKKLYCIKLKKAEKNRLKEYVTQGQKSARSINRARILLLSNDQKTDQEIANVLDTSLLTVHRVRKRYNEKGLEGVLEDKARSGAPTKVDARVEAQLSMIACSDPPEGRKRWTLRLLADKLVELELIDCISHTEVGTLLVRQVKPGCSNKLKRVYPANCPFGQVAKRAAIRSNSVVEAS